jgi:hypothetical protein
VFGGCIFPDNAWSALLLHICIAAAVAGNVSPLPLAVCYFLPAAGMSLLFTHPRAGFLPGK